MKTPADVRRVVVFSKAPRPGRVKTRLAPRLGFDGAAAIHRAFLEDTLSALVDVRAELVVAWGIEAGEELPEDWPGRSRSQGEGDLGDRLARVMAEESFGGFSVVVVGSDHPELRPEVVEDALGQLETGTADVTLGPTPDGGYWLVGCRSGIDTGRLFADTAWSTERVLETTQARAEGLGLRCELVAGLEDVDTPADLDRLMERLATGGAACPATRQALAEVTAVVR